MSLAKPPPLPPRRGLPPIPSNCAPGPSTSSKPRANGAPPSRLPPPTPHRNASLPTTDVTDTSSNDDVTTRGRYRSLPTADASWEFESRFRFHSVSSLPPPEHFTDGKKTYPSQLEKTTQPSAARRKARTALPSPPSQPPPPPPPRLSF
ncbi:WAS/WASL-interacting protein family member 1-like [Littorina saxatilis]|uniref:WAS/WASL-interacting protein family member 1-like n=1 Tax=Littorina saxatilis TaxID=31220 RepID=UPI0038B5D462